MSARLEFSLGPVQAFVAQARRTRDLWGGSYLLSLLTAHAIVGAFAAGASAIEPTTLEQDPMVRWARGEREGEPPRLGSLPNHFGVTARDGDHATAIAHVAEAAMRQAWGRICEAVWQRFVAPAEAWGAGTRAIWDRQVEGFWEIVWAVGEEAPALLARRKLWRTHWSAEEPGDKCAVIPTLQELSGHVRARARQAQDDFWAQVRQQAGAMEAPQGERLSAVAVVKRLFALCDPPPVGWKLDVKAWPSTVDFANASWLRRAQADPSARGLLEELAQLAGSDLAHLNGDYLQPAMLSNQRQTSFGDESTRKAAQEKLDAIAKCRDADGAHGYPAGYYALLLADGDRLGELKRKPGAPGGIARALVAFGEKCFGLDQPHHARRVYAGGDDVLALLPLADAAAYAEGLAQAYQACFEAVGFEKATLSAAVVFAHMTAPLGRVLAEAGRLLDKVAKQENGRSSLALGVFRGDGAALQWVTSWQRGPRRAVAELQDLVEALGRSEATARDLSSGVIHRLHALAWRLLGDGAWRPGAWLVPSGFDFEPLVRAELSHSAEKRGQDSASAATLAKRLAALLHACPGPDGEAATAERLGTDVLLLARFLAGEGREEEHR